ncbi:DUF1266 domain-containing protein [Escherichia coli]
MMTLGQMFQLITIDNNTASLQLRYTPGKVVFNGQEMSEEELSSVPGRFVSKKPPPPPPFRGGKKFICGGSGGGLIYPQFVAQNGMCCGEGGIKAWDYVRMGFLSRVGVLNNWLTEDESLWLQSRVYVRAHHYYHSWMHYFSAYSLGRLYWQSSQCEDNASLREALTLYKYDSAGSRMFEELAAGSDRFYATLPWQPLTVQPECPVTLKDVSDL